MPAFKFAYICVSPNIQPIHVDFGRFSPKPPSSLPLLLLSG